MNELTWTCEICGQSRPNTKISVHIIDMSSKYALPEGTVNRNVTYCDDKPECSIGAMKLKPHTDI